MSRVHDVPSAPESLAGVDLNLLVAFDALARERSVTRAAARVGLTQSAMSHALRRLRVLLGDPLLVRGRGGMVLTPRAEALAMPVRSSLVTLHRALRQPPEFDPSTARRAFRLSSPDLFDVLMLPRLLERIRQEAPGVDIAVAAVPAPALPEGLETGEVDVAVVPRLDKAESIDARAPGLLRRTLFRDHLVCLLRADHPALRSRGKLTVSKYVSLSHAMISPGGTGGGPVDQALERKGLRRRITLRVPNFYSALAIVARSDLVLTGPAGLVRLAPSEPAIVALPPPLRVPGHCIDLVWHERFSSDPGNAWLRELLAAVARAEIGPARRPDSRGG
jgi:DNA-binding transcriptional LysR family regulator